MAMSPKPHFCVFRRLFTFSIRQRQRSVTWTLALPFALFVRIGHEYCIAQRIYNLEASKYVAHE
jgi:hypothetical protein